MKSLLAKIRDKVFGVDKIAHLLKNETEKQIRLSDFNKRELKAFEVLKPYFPDGFLLETSYSLSFQTIQHIINDIVIYKPKVVLEFGSGLSTLILSNFIRKCHLEVRLISLDDDNEWQDLLKSQGAIAEFYCFPITESQSYSYQGVGSWFGITNDHLITKLTYDLVIVDAPKGSICSLSRYGFVPFLRGRLSERAIVYLDDTHRCDEELISKYFLSEAKPEMVIAKHYKYTRFSPDLLFHTSPS